MAGGWPNLTFNLHRYISALSNQRCWASQALVAGKCCLSAVIRMLSPVLDLLANPQDIPFLSGLVQREIIYRLLCGPEGARLRAIATLGDPSHRAAKAIAWIRNNYTKPVRVDDPADIAGMGVSTFHHHFRVLTNMSPLQYQRQLRLQAARGRMLVDGMDASTAAIEVGYESVRPFNREYSRFFGHPPMRDIRNLRLPGAPAMELVSQQNAPTSAALRARERIAIRRIVSSGAAI
jgi:AraC-like DNA-binding protein